MYWYATAAEEVCRVATTTTRASMLITIQLPHRLLLLGANAGEMPLMGYNQYGRSTHSVDPATQRS